MTAAARLRRGLLAPTLGAIAAFAVLVSLGLWQLDRKAWKEGLIATMEQRLPAAPVSLPAPPTWPRLTATEDEFLHVAMTAEFLNDREALVFTSGSALREGSGGPGYWVFMPARLAGGALVMVNRGFVPEGKRDRAARPDGAVAGPINMVGVLRWPEPPGMFTPAGDPTRNIWFSRDSTAIAMAMASALRPFISNWKALTRPGACLGPAGCIRPFPIITW